MTVPQKPQQPLAADQTDAVTPPRTEPPKMDAAFARRALFGTGLVGALLQQACSNSNFAGTGSQAKRSKDTANPAGDDAGDGPKADAPGGTDGPGGKDSPTGTGDANGDSSGGNDAGNGSDACTANKIGPLDTSAMAAVDDTLKPDVKFYGKTSSALVALQFSRATADIQHIVLVSPSGKMIAMHGLTGADKDSSGKYRPIVVDNIWLQDGGTDIPELHVVVVIGGVSKLHKEPVEFFTTFQSKPVKDLSGGTVPPEMIGHQSVTRFAEGTGAGNFNVDTSVTYPNTYNTTSVRNLQTVKSTTTWSAVPAAPNGLGIMGTVTDIMGNPIDILTNGALIIEYQVFCTYSDNGGTWARTILHIG